MKNDPEELCDLGEDQAYNTILQEMRDLMFESLRRCRTRTTCDNDYMKMRAKHALENNSKRPVYIGVW
jgi:hypothetical protein